MNESPNILLFGEVLHKYRFTEPAPADIQHFIRENKRKQFQKIMKRTAGYSVLFALISHMFFTIRKYGIAITIVKSAILLGVLSLITAAAVTTGVYLFVVRGAQDAVMAPAMEFIRGAVREGNAGDHDDYLKEPPAVIEDRLGIQPFAGVHMPDARAARLSDRMAKTLSSLRGNDRVVNLRLGRGGRKSGMMLFGSVESSAGTWIVSARVASVKDSRILFYDTETAGSEPDLEGACDRLARRIYDAIR